MNGSHRSAPVPSVILLFGEERSRLPAVFIASLTLISKDKLDSEFTSRRTDESCLLHNHHANPRQQLEVKILCPKDTPRLPSFILMHSYLPVMVSVLLSKVMKAVADSHRRF